MTAAKWAGLSAPAWLLLALLLGLPAPRHPGNNVISRFATTVQLVERGEFSLGPYTASTNDAAIRDGKAYSDKAPGVSLLLAPIYAVARLGRPTFDQALQICRTLSLTLFTLYTLLALGRALPKLGVDGLARSTTLVVYGVGTVGWAYYAMLFGHGFAAHAVTLGVLRLMQSRREPARARWLWESGLWFGAAAVFEYPAIVLGVCAGVYLLSFERRPSRIAAFAACAAALPAVVVGLYNFAAFGEFWRLGYSVAKKDPYYTTAMSKGFFGFGRPTLANFWLQTFSPNKGLFFWSPVLLLGVGGLAWAARRRPREAALMAGMTAAYLALFAGYFEGSGGAGLGPRHLTPLLGPLLLAAAWLAAESGAWALGAWVGLGAGSSALALIGVFSEPQMPDRLVNPLWEFAIPLLREGVGPGNLFGLGDRAATMLAGAALATLWLFVFLGRPEADQPATSRWRGPALAAALAVGFFVLAASRLPPSDPGIRRQVLGNHFMTRRDWARAASEYEAAAAFRADPWIRYYQAKAYFHLGAPALARRSLARLLEVDPSFMRRLGSGEEGEEPPPAPGASVGPPE